MRRRPVLLGTLLALVLLSPRVVPFVAASASLEIMVKDEKGKPLGDAVVWLASTTGAVPAPRPATAVMDQQNKTFVPLVLAIPMGTSVSFPNRDNIRHHVYSFSTAKRFELPLYIGTPAAPVVFDKPGVVVLGCNIHDWMVGYIYVSATSHFAKTADDGLGRLADIAPGAYEARVWHPRMRAEPDKIGKAITLADGDPGRIDFVLALKPERKVYPPPTTYDRPQS